MNDGKHPGAGGSARGVRDFQRERRGNSENTASNDTKQAEPESDLDFFARLPHALSRVRFPEVGEFDNWRQLPIPPAGHHVIVVVGAKRHPETNSVIAGGRWVVYAPWGHA